MGGGGNARTPVCTGHKIVCVGGGGGGSKDSSVHWSQNSTSCGGGMQGLQYHLLATYLQGLVKCSWPPKGV